MIGRLAPDATVERAAAELAAMAANLEAQYPEANDGRGVHVERMSDVIFGPVRPPLYLLLAAVGLLLLVACVNVANLQLARGAVRAQEVAVRRALGADGGRLLRQFLVESLVLTLTAAVAGVGVAYVGLELLLALAPAGIPRLSLVSIDLTVLTLALGTAVAVGIVFGIIPLFQARRSAVQSALNDQGGIRASSGPGLARLRSILVVAELALAVMLLAGAGLLVRSFWALQQVDPGFRARGVAKVEYTLPPSRYPVRMPEFPDFPEHRAFTTAIIEEARRLPGVTAAAVAGNHPLDPGSTNSFTVIGREAEAQAWPELSIRRVTPGYFETVGLSLIEGRLLDERDTIDAEPVVIVNETVARRFFPAGDAMGARFRWWGTTRTVVGIVADERIYGIAEAPPVAVYVPLAQAPSVNGAGVLLVRGADPDGLASAAARVIRARDPALAVFGVETLQRTVSRSVSARRFTTVLLLVFAGVALLLGAIGVYSVLSYDVARRRREMGIRLAIGARPSGILRLVFNRGLRLTALGIGVGVAGALALARFLSAMLFGIPPDDPVTLGGVALVLAVVALAATAVPAWRAAHVDPTTALRDS
jgi:predicted permease